MQYKCGKSLHLVHLSIGYPQVCKEEEEGMVIVIQIVVHSVSCYQLLHVSQNRAVVGLVGTYED